MNIPLTKPFINEAIKKRVMDVLDSGHLTEGPVTATLEEIAADYVGASHCLAVTSCTVGLEMALRCLKIGEGDEVIVPDYTYPATADAVAIVGARTVLVDVNPVTMLIDHEQIEEAITPNTKAIMPVSLFGNPLDYEQLNRIKAKHGLFIIEDAACALGAEYKGSRTGKLADISVFSLHPRKFITSGEGGLVTTDNDQWAAWMHSYKKFGMSFDTERAETVFNIIGTNYKLSDILSSVAVGQFQYVDELLAKRRSLAAQYSKLLDGTPGIVLPETTAGGTHSYQTFCIHVAKRDTIMANLRAKGIEVQIGTYCLHCQPAFAPSPLFEVMGEMHGSDLAFNSCLALPMYFDMTDKEVEIVVSSLKSELTA